MPFRLVFAVIFALSLPSLLPAKAKGNRAPQQPSTPSLQPTEVKGTIQDTGTGGLVITDSKNKTWRVFPSANGMKLHVTGTLAASQLKAGMLVELTADFDDHGVIQKPIDSLAVTSISEEKRAGVFPAGGGAPVGTGGDAAGKRPAGKAGTRAVSGTFRVVGRLNVNNRTGSLSIQIPNNKPQFTLADNVKINVDMANFSLVTRGSAVTVSGTASAAKPGYIQAADITIVVSPAMPGDGTGGKKAAAGH